MIGYGLQNLLKSPMAQGQQGQFPDPSDIVSQIMAQFAEYVRKRGAGAVPSGGRQGIQQPMAQQPPLASGGGMGAGAAPGMPAIQAPVGIPPRESAGRLRTAAGEGAGAFMQQAGEEAAEPWKPKGLDIGLLGAAIALPIIAALQPEGRGRRGQRKQKRMGELFKGLGELAGKGLQARKGAFETGKEAAFEAAKTRAEMSVEEAQAGYERKIGGIEAAEKKRQWEKGFGLAERGIAVKELPKAPDERLALAREKFDYDKEQDRLNRQLQDAESTGQYPKDYLLAVAKLNQSLSANIDLGEDQKREAFDLGVLRLNRLYGITPTRKSLRLGIGTAGNTDASTLLERLRQEQGPLENLR